LAKFGTKLYFDPGRRLVVVKRLALDVGFTGFGLSFSTPVPDGIVPSSFGLTPDGVALVFATGVFATVLVAGASGLVQPAKMETESNIVNDVRDRKDMDRFSPKFYQRKPVCVLECLGL
jgi:hypothetical protein